MNPFVAHDVDRNKYYLVTPRGLILLGHPMAINSAREAYPTVEFDNASWQSLQTIHKPAP